MSFDPASDMPTPNDPRGARERSIDLRERIPAHAVISELLALQSRHQPPSLLGRVFGVDPLHPDSRPWYQGALGEIRIGKVLASLSAEWTVLHAVPVGTGSSDIDHVLIGPAGVFTINTKNHGNQNVWVAGNTLMVAGRKQRHIPNAAHEAARTAKLLSAALTHPISVQGVVVVVGAKSLTIREKPATVKVLTDRQLVRWITRHKPVLSPEQVADIAAVANQPKVWHRNPPHLGDPATLHHGFRELQKRVSSARTRRAAWAFGALAVIGPLLAALIPQILGP